MTLCIAFGCSNRTTRKSAKQRELEVHRKITFHKFPKNPERHQAWVKAADRVGYETKENSYLCSLHFTEESFDRSSSLSRVRLLDTAIPTIFPTKLQIRKKSRRVLTNKNRLKRNISHEPSEAQIEESFENVSKDLSTARKTLQKVLQKQKNDMEIPRFISRSTSCSPIHTMSPTEEMLRKTLKETRQYYRRKLKTLQAAHRRSRKKIARLEYLLSNKKNNNVLSSIAIPNSRILKQQNMSDNKANTQQDFITYALSLHNYSRLSCSEEITPKSTNEDVYVYVSDIEDS